MEALCVAQAAVPSCCTQAGAAVNRNSERAWTISRRTASCRRTRLACSSSSYLLGSTDIGALRAQRKEVRPIFLRGIRCETTQGGNNTKVDVWIGRLAMLGFVAAIGTEVASGKGVLANLGVSTPAPTLALALTAVVGAVVSFGVFRSATEE